MPGVGQPAMDAVVLTGYLHGFSFKGIEIK
jgi:hypothetical protein